MRSVMACNKAGANTGGSPRWLGTARMSTTRTRGMAPAPTRSAMVASA